MSKSYSNQLSGSNADKGYWVFLTQNNGGKTFLFLIRASCLLKGYKTLQKAKKSVFEVDSKAKKVASCANVKQRLILYEVCVCVASLFRLFRTYSNLTK